MNPELIQAWAAIITALAWSVAILISIVILRNIISPAIARNGTFRFKVRDVAELSIEPTQVIRPPSAATAIGWWWRI